MDTQLIFETLEKELGQVYKLQKRQELQRAAGPAAAAAEKTALYSDI